MYFCYTYMTTEINCPWTCTILLRFTCINDQILHDAWVGLARYSDDEAKVEVLSQSATCCTIDQSDDSTAHAGPKMKMTLELFCPWRRSEGHCISGVKGHLHGRCHDCASLQRLSHTVFLITVYAHAVAIIVNYIRPTLGMLMTLNQ